MGGDPRDRGWGRAGGGPSNTEGLTTKNEGRTTGSNRSPSWFTRFARATAYAAGRPLAFGLAASTIVAWSAVGPVFGFSNTWQLVINTGTTIVTFLMVFIIQHTQNRDAEAVQLKLGELIRAVEGAHNALVDLDELDDEELERLHAKYAALAKKARERAKRGQLDTDRADTE